MRGCTVDIECIRFDAEAVDTPKLDRIHEALDFKAYVTTRIQNRIRGLNQSQVEMPPRFRPLVNVSKSPFCIRGGD